MIRQGSDNSQSTRFEDRVLRSLYIMYDTPCDRFVSDPERLAAFVTAYAEQTGKTIGPTQLGRHLLNLRKREEANGGLPRLRR